MFLKGPIPCHWLERAAKLSGKALHVAVALWFLAGLTRRREVKLTRSTLKRFGVLPDAARRALGALEKDGLVSVQRSPGRSPLVSLQDGDRRPGEEGDEPMTVGDG